MTARHQGMYPISHLSALIFDEDGKGFMAVPVGHISDLVIDSKLGFWTYRDRRRPIGEFRVDLNDRKGVVLVYDEHRREHTNLVIRLVQEQYRGVSLV